MRPVRHRKGHIERAAFPRRMDYPPAVQQLLAKAGAAVGDTVAVTARRDRLEGVVMPHHAFSGADILTLKLGNGYNVGIDLKDITGIDLVSKHAPATKRHGSCRGTPAFRSSACSVR